MEKLEIEATKYTPEILFDYENNRLSIRGKSYPENTAEFYAPVFDWLEAYLGQLEDQKARVDMEIHYLNSSSSKVLLDFFDLLEDATGEGKQISINWIYEENDEDSREFGREFQEDFDTLNLNLIQKEA
jgi:hypothetical protein